MEKIGNTLVVRSDAPLAAVVDEACRLHRKIKEWEAVLDIHKKTLRAEAEAVLIESTGNEKTVQFLGSSGAGSGAKVTFVDSTLVVKGSAEELKQLFGDQFSEVFEVVVKIKDRELYNRIEEERNGPFRLRTAALVIQKPSTPKVIL